MLRFIPVRISISLRKISNTRKTFQEKSIALTLNIFYFYLFLCTKP